MTEANPDVDGMKEFNRGVIDEFRANGGKVGGPFEGGNMVLLTTKGAKTGQPRLVPLAYIPIDGRIVIVGSLAGAPVDPQWVRNLRANPAVFIEVGAEAYEAVAQELPRDERDALWPTVTEIAPVFADYQSKTDRVIPLFELTRS
jgi:deazaflavin-dependent oxidoreductase (nitroreductase family)